MNFFPFASRHLLIAALLLSTMSGHTFAKEKEDPPINIEADRMVSKEDKNTVVFIGNVDASQGKVTIRTDEMTVYYEQNNPDQPKGKSSKVKKMICVGNVEITQDDWLGTGERMEYFANERKVILSGNAKTSEGKNMVSSDTVTYYLDEKRSVFEQDQSKPGRVKAVIQPK